MKNDIKDNLYDLYSVYSQYKLLHEFWGKYRHIKNEDEIKERLEYLKKNPQCKQRSEIECLLWLLGKVE